MLALGIVCFILAAALAYFAFQPKLAFYLDEGWKFRDRTEPSDTYVAVNGVGRIIGAVVAVVVGIACIGEYFGEKSEARAKQQQSDRYAAAQQRCEAQVRPRFNQTIKWDDGKITNPDELNALASELRVEIEIMSTTSPGPNRTRVPTSNMFVRDPTLPEYQDSVLFYGGTPDRLGSTTLPDECSLSRPPL
ncbi:DUF6199 family natural product biosynthesis protein [Mycolicibacterium fortuitum]|uniref:DUF6199 family natural product biosynthesis protein n=1 Tax=Mycolicibacterium fortuitum TaxID=1766 RepID=UPI0007EBAF1D|nr:DUF6199 family natural product biosynthesis protein [Mycolicibacterium fortuitum]NOP97351.1 hypothetical protein [Mycolicibacterium fortuitum]OBA95109.1 hypothetical protein A5665_05125 [Mycolicibacterium fortuitum]OBI62061.1 hypothetical protein A5667_10095 [Mycolicibacterium fortuitum]OBI65472.1 hypothetical protein A5666_06540 [Mycolicibacterium fortuitum]